MITEFGFPACCEAEDPVFLGMFNATSLSLRQLHLPVVRQRARPRVRTVYPRDEREQARLLIDQLRLLDQARVEGAFV